jgi:DNA repair protein RecO (recombination protein O)
VQLSTDAIVLHAFDYRETSRIVRLLTRDLGIVAVIARGARRPKSKYGAALDLFASGTAQIATTVGRDLHTLTAFEATASRAALAASLDRFAAAAALAELLLRFAPEQEDARLLDAATETLDALAVAPPGSGDTVALGGAWRLLAELGFAPSLDECAACHASLDPGAAVAFHHRTGGVLCDACAGTFHGARLLPAEARHVMRGWLAARESPPLDAPTVRAHQRLLREFLEEHLTDGGRPLRALLAWERHEVDA